MQSKLISQTPLIHYELNFIVSLNLMLQIISVYTPESKYYVQSGLY